MMYLNTWIHLIDYFVVTYGHKSINDKMCFLHPLHLTQSPLEAYFSVLRGLDANSCITGGTLVHRIKAARVVSNNTLIKPRIRCSYDIEDIPDLCVLNTTLKSSNTDEHQSESTAINCNILATEGGRFSPSTSMVFSVENFFSMRNVNRMFSTECNNAIQELIVAGMLEIDNFLNLARGKYVDTAIQSRFVRLVSDRIKSSDAATQLVERARDMYPSLRINEISHLEAAQIYSACHDEYVRNRCLEMICGTDMEQRETIEDISETRRSRILMIGGWALREVKMKNGLKYDSIYNALVVDRTFDEYDMNMNGHESSKMNGHESVRRRKGVPFKQYI